MQQLCWLNSSFIPDTDLARMGTASNKSLHQSTWRSITSFMDASLKNIATTLLWFTKILMRVLWIAPHWLFKALTVHMLFYSRDNMQTSRIENHTWSIKWNCLQFCQKYLHIGLSTTKIWMSSSQIAVQSLFKALPALMVGSLHGISC